MPKCILAKKGHLGFDIHDLTADDDEYVRLKKKNPLSREGREGNLGWEPVSNLLLEKYLPDLIYTIISLTRANRHL